MPLGYCMDCDTLRSIKPGPLRLGSRECEWFPIQHEAPPRHRDCGGIVYEIETGGVPELVRACDLCEQVIDDDVIEPAHPCDGHKHAIR